MPTLASLLEDFRPRGRPDRAAVVLGDVSLSYAALNASANQVANLLVARGIKLGDQVALTCPNVLPFPIVYYGILKAGAIVVPLNVLLTSPGDRLPPGRLPGQGVLLLRGLAGPAAAENGPRRLPSCRRLQSSSSSSSPTRSPPSTSRATGRRGGA